jgi:hypothetical protein
MLSASSRPFAISASTKDEVHSTETRSSLTGSSWHVGSSPRDSGVRAERTGQRPRGLRSGLVSKLCPMRVTVPTGASLGGQPRSSRQHPLASKTAKRLTTVRRLGTPPVPKSWPACGVSGWVYVSGALSADNVPHAYTSTVVTLAHPSVESPGHCYVGLSYPSVPGRLQVGCRHIGQSDRGFDGRASVIVIR